MDSFVVQDLAGDVKKRFYTSNYEVKWLLPIVKKQKEDCFMKDKLGRKIKSFAAMRPKMYCYLADEGPVDKKAMGTKKCVIRWEIRISRHGKGSEVMFVMYLLKRSTRLLLMEMIMREYKLLMESSYVYMLQVLE